jgi:hypothetical protein
VRAAENGAAIAVALAIALGAAAAGAAADLENVAIEGAAPVAAVAPGGAGAVRQAALEAGVREAVLQVADEVARESGGTPDPAATSAALGKDLLGYAVRFRLLEDRGERPASKIQQPGVAREYAVQVDVEVDRGRIRSRLAGAGLVKAAAKPAAQAAPPATLDVTFEGIDRYATWERLRQALAARGSAVRPLEFARGRVVAQVDTDEPPAALAERLRQAVGDTLGIALRSAEGRELRIEVLQAPAPPPQAAPPAETAAPQAAAPAPPAHP